MVLGNRYELIEQIGEGGMATVYKARCRILDRIVAIKILKEDLSRDKSFVEKFRVEALAAARISHPNIVNIYDVGQEGDIHYIVMEYVEGKTLKEIIRRQAPLSIAKAVDIAIMICDGVHHAHQKGVIHRDIKPHNILVTDTGMVKVADFGIARAISSATITFGGNMVGSVHYISPEQAKGEPVNRTTDIYSIGCVLYEMVTGKVPFDAESPITVALKHIHDDVPSPVALNKEIPDALEGIILQAMAKIPAHRFATAEEMRNTLLNIHGNGFSLYGDRTEKTLVRPNPISEGDENVVKNKRKIRSMNIAIIAIAILGLLSGAVFMMGGSLFGSEVAVPNIENMDIRDANTKLKELGLKMNIIDEQYNDEVEKDRIISQEPSPGQKVKKGREIKVIISKGAELTRVPSLVGYDIDEAETMLQNKGLRLGRTEEAFNNRFAEGQVISQDPEAGEEVSENTKVNVVISKGSEKDRVAMPSLEGLTLQEAKTKLADSGLEIGKITRQESNKYYSDQVISQDTSPGVKVEEGSTVNLVVSSGPGPVTETKAVEFTLPDQQEFYKVVITIKDEQGTRQVYDQIHQASDTVNVILSHFGDGIAEVTVNGQHFKTYSL
ncbi:MAG: protein kinase domain-containing protein [Syntrophomonadaceae bacterium]